MPDFIITYTAPQGARISAAFGKLRGYKDAAGVARPATAAEVRAELVNYMQSVVKEVEGRDAADVARNGVADLGIVP